MDKEKWKESYSPKHAAISLSGEPTIYPYLPELIREFHRKHMTTFVVTNGTNPDMLQDIMPTQLYISLNAHDKETYKKLCAPLGDTWNNIYRSLETIKDSRTRTAVRITLIKGVNMTSPSGFARLIKVGEPDFVELKAYMHLWFSRNRLLRDNMPSHKEVLQFSKKVAEASGFIIVDDSQTSRAVLLSRDGTKHNI
jgi:tRNA wybutosine-synthesizing protein 1